MGRSTVFRRGAVFLKDTLDAAQNDAEALVVDKIHKKAEFVVKSLGFTYGGG